MTPDRRPIARLLPGRTTGDGSDVAERPRAERRGAISLRRATLLGLLGTTSMVVGAVMGGTVFVNHLPGAWFFGTPGAVVGSVPAAARQPSVLPLLFVYGGLILLTRAWLGLLRGLAQGTPVRQVVNVIAAWSVPLVIGPPLFSRDIFSYAAQGELVSRHIDPYLFGTGVLGATPFNALAGPLWANTPSPYGPTFLGLDGYLTRIAHHQVLADLVLLRLVALVGVGLIVVSVVSLARAHGLDPARAVLLGAGSPLVLTTFVGGGHNDALMVGLLLAGLAVARRFGTLPGIALCALAAGVKAPALLGVIFLGWNWAGPRARVWARMAHTAAAGALAGAVLAVVSMATGIGWGWTRTFGAADKVFTGVTPVDAAARVLSGLGGLAHLSTPLAGTRTVLAGVALVVAAAVGAWLLVRSPLLGTERALGLSLLALAVCGPILWAWYLTWGAVVLAAVAHHRSRLLVITVSTAGAFIGVTAVKGVAVTLWSAPMLADLLLLAALAVACVVPLTRRVPLDREADVAGRPQGAGSPVDLLQSR